MRWSHPSAAEERDHPDDREREQGHVAAQVAEEDDRGRDLGNCEDHHEHDQLAVGQLRRHERPEWPTPCDDRNRRDPETEQVVASRDSRRGARLPYSAPSAPARDRFSAERHDVTDRVEFDEQLAFDDARS